MNKKKQHSFFSRERINWIEKACLLWDSGHYTIEFMQDVQFTFFQQDFPGWQNSLPDRCLSCLSPALCFAYNRFKLFFLASTFFLSTGAFAARCPSFLGNAADVPTAGSAGEFWSCEFEPGTLVAAVAHNAVGADAALPHRFVLDWSTFTAVVDSEIVPLLGLLLGFRAWMLVYNLHKVCVDN